MQKIQIIGKYKVHYCTFIAFVMRFELYLISSSVAQILLDENIILLYYYVRQKQLWRGKYWRKYLIMHSILWWWYFKLQWLYSWKMMIRWQSNFVWNWYKMVLTSILKKTHRQYWSEAFSGDSRLTISLAVIFLMATKQNHL